MSKTKLTALLVATIMVFTLLAGCGGSTTEKATEASKTDESTATAAAPEKLEQVTLKIMLPGDRPADMDKVLAEAEKRMADTVNAKIDLTFIPWSDLKQKTQVQLASGEKVDLIFDAPWLHIDQMISSGYYVELSDLLNKYGQNVLKNRPQQMWDYNKFGGKIMGIPLGNAFYQGTTYYVRKDLREKLGIAPIKTYDELIKFAYAVKEKESKIIPLLPRSKEMAWASFRQTWDPSFTWLPVSASLLYRKANDTKIYNLFDEKDPIIWKYITETRKLYTDKIIYQDVLTVKDADEQFKAGKAAVIVHNDFGVPADIQNTLKQNVPGAEAEAVTLMNMTPKAYGATFKMWNFLCLAEVSENKERAIMFLDWANQKENYDLLAYGIQGTNWEPKGDDQYAPIGTGYSYFPYAWIWNPVFDRLDASQDAETVQNNKFLRVADNFETDKLAGFNFNTEPVKNELAQYQAIDDKYFGALYNGVLDPDTTYEKYKAEAGALLKKVQEEAQKQVDEFLSK